MAKRFVSIGECMVELAPAADGMFRQSFAGDTLNTAWYARAALPPDWAVDYVSAVGDDPLSAGMLAMMAGAGIGTGGIRRIAGGTPGLYLIALQEGERSFSYWRDSSAARRLADDPVHLRRALRGADAVYFSGITLAILARDAVQRLLAELGAAKQAGARIIFDPNIRPRLWPDPHHTRATIAEGARLSDLVLPSFDDEAAHFGDRTPADTLARYAAWGVADVVVKDGARGAHYCLQGLAGHVPACRVDRIVDTTSAGDSFNGALIAALMQGLPAGRAVSLAARTAAVVIGQPGALVDHGALRHALTAAPAPDRGGDS